MPTKRQNVRRRIKQHISPEAVRLYRRGVELVARRDECGDDWPDAEREEWLDVHEALHMSLGLPPWEISPVEVDDGPSPWPEYCAGGQTWPHAQELRRQLEAASGGK